jgi:hypothetical protein
MLLFDNGTSPKTSAAPHMGSLCSSLPTRRTPYRSAPLRIRFHPHPTLLVATKCKVTNAALQLPQGSTHLADTPGSPRTPLRSYSPSAAQAMRLIGGSFISLVTMWMVYWVHPVRLPRK